MKKIIFSILCVLSLFNISGVSGNTDNISYNWLSGETFDIFEDTIFPIYGSGYIYPGDGRDYDNFSSILSVYGIAKIDCPYVGYFERTQDGKNIYIACGVPSDYEGLLNWTVIVNGDYIPINYNNAAITYIRKRTQNKIVVDIAGNWFVQSGYRYVYQQKDDAIKSYILKISRLEGLLKASGQSKYIPQVKEISEKLSDKQLNILLQRLDKVGIEGEKVRKYRNVLKLLETRILFRLDNK